MANIWETNDVYRYTRCNESNVCTTDTNKHRATNIQYSGWINWL